MDMDGVVNSLHQFVPNKGSNYRKVLLLIVNNPPSEIMLGDWDHKGDIEFSIAMTDIGLQYKDYSVYRNEIFSYFMIDLIGELIVRENLPIFVNKFQEYDMHNYNSIVETHGKHKRFGVRTEKGRLFFEFHVSFLKELLIENVRESLV